jgi:hypothetical protein
MIIKGYFGYNALSVVPVQDVSEIIIIREAIYV